MAHPSGQPFSQGEFFGDPIGTHTTVADTATAVYTLLWPNDSDYVVLKGTAKDFRMTFDGVTDPTTTVGFLIQYDTAIAINRQLNGSVKILSVAAGGGIEYQAFRRFRDSNT